MGMCDPLTEGYAAHLSKLSAPGGSVPAQGNARMVIPRSATPSLIPSRRKLYFFRTCFGLKIFFRKYFSEPVLVCPDSFNTSRCHCAIAPNFPCGPIQKSNIDIEEELQLKKVKMILRRICNETDFIISDTTQLRHQLRRQQTIEILPKRRIRNFNQTSSEMDVKLAIRQD